MTMASAPRMFMTSSAKRWAYSDQNILLRALAGPGSLRATTSDRVRRPW
jgi:hypothetical protein